jgi:hypothetical protein
MGIEGDVSVDTRPRGASIGPARQRLVFRAVSDFLMRFAARVNQRHSRDLVRAMLWLAFNQASRGTPSLECLTRNPRPVSMRAVSRSMDIPYETTRRKLLELEAEGHCRRTPDGGMVLAADDLTSPERRAAAAADCQAVRDLIGGLRGIGFDPAPYGSVAWPGAGANSPEQVSDLELVAAMVMEDFILRACESGAAIHGSLLNGLVFLTLLTLNAAPITFDSEQAWRYAGADTPPPDELRRPVPLSQIAKAVCLPTETVRRRMVAFLAADWAEHRPDGYRLKMERMQAPEVLASGAAISQLFVQMTTSLVQIGFELPPGPGQSG